MKKVLSIFLCLVMVLSMAFVLTGCTKKAENGENGNQGEVNKDTPVVTSKYKTEKLFNTLKDGKFTMEMKYEDDGSIQTVKLTADGDDYGMSIESTEESGSVIVKANEMYMVDHSSKSVIKFGSADDAEEDTKFLDAFDGVESLDELFVEKGKKEIDGVEYDYETFKDNKDSEETSTYYYKGNDLKYVGTSTDDSLIEIISINDSVDKSLLDIPSDYEIMDLASLFSSFELEEETTEE